MDADARAGLAAIARRWVEAGWSAGGPDAPRAGAIVDELHDPDFIDHDSGGRAPDNAGFRDGHRARCWRRFPTWWRRAL
jgi:hypothetical protein